MRRRGKVGRAQPGAVLPGKVGGAGGGGSGSSTTPCWGASCSTTPSCWRRRRRGCGGWCGSRAPSTSRPLDGKPAILLAPHFIGLDQGCARLTLEHALAGLYTPQHSRLGDALVTRARQAMGAERLDAIDNTRPDAVRALLRSLRGGRWLYYTNDIDYRDYGRSVFVPFMGVPDAATLSALPRLARRLEAAVLFCVATARPWGGYEVEISPPLEDFPSGDDARDMARFNERVGAYVARHPAQYYWPHRRFKTRPHGAAPLYDL